MIVKTACKCRRFFWKRKIFDPFSCEKIYFKTKRLQTSIYQYNIFCSISFSDLICLLFDLLFMFYNLFFDSIDSRIDSFFEAITYF